MAAKDPEPRVDLDQLERLLWLMSALGVLMVALGLIGELRGWWNDVGEVLVAFGTVASVATAIVALLINATKAQVRRASAGIEANGGKLDRIYEDHGAQLEENRAQAEANGQKLDEQTEMLGSQSEKLDEQTEMLDSHGEKLDQLHEDMTQQHDVLVQIRDRL